MRTIRDDDGPREAVAIEGVVCTAASEKAIRVRIDGDHYWIPQSQVTDDSEVYRKGDEGKLVITRWIAEQKGLAE